MADEVKERIIKILEMTFDAIDKCYRVNDEKDGEAKHETADSRLIFPCYYEGGENKETRISEQELRFLFIEQFNRYCDNVENPWDAYYSIETPTRWKYRFSGEEKPPTPHRVKEEGEEGQSAMVDVCIHDKKGRRICLIEFKFGNPEKFCFEKDLVKLQEESNLREESNQEEEAVLCFFVHLLKSQQSDTLPSILGKIKDITTDEEPKNVDFSKINYVCHTLPKKKGQTGKTKYVANKNDENDEFEEMGKDRVGIDLSDPEIKNQIKEYKEKIESRKKNNQ